MSYQVFTEVVVYGYKAGKCACGKRRERTKRFSQTVNPFNRYNGKMKTMQQIRTELKMERGLWLSEPITCKKCEAADVK